MAASRVREKVKCRSFPSLLLLLPTSLLLPFSCTFLLLSLFLTCTYRKKSNKIYFGPKPFLFPFIITSSLSPSSLLVLQHLQCLDSSPSEEPSAVIASSLCFSLPLCHLFYPSFVISISYYATTRTAEERREEPESVPSRNLSAAATQASGKRK